MTMQLTAAQRRAFKQAASAGWLAVSGRHRDCNYETYRQLVAKGLVKKAPIGASAMVQTKLTGLGQQLINDLLVAD